VLDTLMLSRIQFGFVISFHILFPAFTIGLSWWLLFLEAVWLRERTDLWRDLYFFWMKIFAVSFGLGVVSGIVMSFQFGTNWPAFSMATGSVLGPLLNYEVLTAFFLEATFLGVMLFGWRRVGHGMHFVATAMVATGTLLSSFWIISANSWMQTPAGFGVENGVYYPTSWWAIVFNPSFPYRLVHMLLAAFLTTALVIGGVSATYLLRNRFVTPARKMLKLALAFVAIVIPVQILAGDLSGLQLARTQPAKLAAIEALWESGRGVPLTLFAIPDAQAETNRHAVEVPRLGSLILTHSVDGEVAGLEEFAPRDRPPVAGPFFGFRIMVGLGLLILLLSVTGVVLWRGDRLFRHRWYLRCWQIMTPAGFAALLTGWYVAEIGRQPWIVYGLMRTEHAVSRIGAGSVASSLAVYGIVYSVIFGFGTWYLLKMLRQGPLRAPPRAAGPLQTPSRPLSAAQEPEEIQR
jgi:cytochrome d ubiquinol oxidase subunit I